MRILHVIIFQLAVCMTVFSQSNIDVVLDEIERNNTGLTAHQKQIEAKEIFYKTDIYPHNPDFEFAWFRGSPYQIGNRINLSLIQSFDFPTAYVHRNRIARGRSDQLLLEFETQRRNLLLDARLLCLDLIYTNAVAQEYELRLDHARNIMEAYEKMLDAGQTNILEYNKTRLNYLNLQKEAEKIQIERETIHNQLAALNGGIPVILDDVGFEKTDIPVDYERWYAQAEQNNPVLKWLSDEIEISRNQEKLQMAMSLPAFSAGYVSEALTHEQFRGFAVGVSIPLWENRNKMKYARAHTFALESMESDQKLQYYQSIKTQHSRAISLQNSALEYRSLLESIDSSELLFKAWEQGEISLTNYILELSLYYHSIDNILKTELELNQAIAVLNQFMD
jgi:outer membrane protein, heavy metal efflux system